MATLNLYKDFKRVKDVLPPKKTLCLVVFPVAELAFNGIRYHRIAAAYYRGDGTWIYADEPALLNFEPYYWAPLELVS
jgi:hypothetical protein